jgi:hypothetical protein
MIRTSLCSFSYDRLPSFPSVPSHVVKTVGTIASASVLKGKWGTRVGGISEPSLRFDLNFVEILEWSICYIKPTSGGESDHPYITTLMIIIPQRLPPPRGEREWGLEVKKGRLWMVTKPGSVTANLLGYWIQFVSWKAFLSHCPRNVSLLKRKFFVGLYK